MPIHPYIPLQRIQEFHPFSILDTNPTSKNFGVLARHPHILTTTSHFPPYELRSPIPFHFLLPLPIPPSSSAYENVDLGHIGFHDILCCGLAMLFFEVAPYSRFVGEADITVGAAVWPLTAVEVHVVMER